MSFLIKTYPWVTQLCKVDLLENLGRFKKCCIAVMQQRVNEVSKTILKRFVTKSSSFNLWSSWVLIIYLIGFEINVLLSVEQN